jgi:putative colanic acid biosynthesis glycosyltransferase WcaI
MRILFFADNFKPETNAPATHIYERCRLWAAAGHEVTVVTCAPNFPEGRVYPGYENRLRTVETMDGIRVVRVKTYITANEGFARRTLDYVSYVPSALFFALREARPDVVISSSPQLFVAVAGVVYSMFRRVPHVFELRDLWPASILATSSIKPGRLYRMLERLELFLYRRSRRVLSFTNAFREDLMARGVPANKIDVVVNGASLDIFAPQERRDPAIESQLGLGGRFVVGYLGTLGLAHGLENVVHAAELLKDDPITFLFVGGGAARAGLEQLVLERKLTNVILAPRVAKEILPRYWSVCDASLVHLKNDPLFASVIPSKIFESMAVGLPIVYVGPEGEGSQIVREHEAGMALPSAEPRLLADAVRRMAADPALRSRFAANSRAAAPLYSRERQAERTLEVLQRAVNGKIGETL